jgi:hypothetical protein
MGAEIVPDEAEKCADTTRVRLLTLGDVDRRNAA